VFLQHIIIQRHQFTIPPPIIMVATIGLGMGTMAAIMGDITVNTIKDTTVGIIENIMVVDTVVDIGDSWGKNYINRGTFLNG